MQKRPKRVLHVMNAAVGGAALSTVALIRGLRDQGVESAIVCHSSGDANERAALVDLVNGRCEFLPLYWWNKKIRTKTWKRPLFELYQSARTGRGYGSSVRVAGHARAWDVDTIHSNTIVTLEGARVARMLNLPHVWHVRELVGPTRPTRLRYQGRALGKYLEHHSSMVIANSFATAACLREFLREDWLRVVPNGIDVEAFAPLVGRESTSKKVVVAMVGNVTSVSKRHALFLDAAAAVGDPNVEYRIYGYDPGLSGEAPPGSYAMELRARPSAQALGQQLVWRGFVDSPVTIMSEIDVLVHPYEEESFGRAIAEAMAAGLPLVGVNGGGPAELIVDHKTGLLARPNDVSDLARCIRTVAASAETRATFGANGRERAVANYSISACVEGVLDAYEAAMERPVPRFARLAGAY
ncbi:MAG: glycosyltransferase family 4 protein [Sandaracinaceae bacterium]|nr:glycosyltransferase family 4 protein [Sandaracinaceae bacterium]